MARFDRYMLSQLMVLFGFASLVLILVYWINRAVVLFDQLVGDGQGMGVFLEFTLLSLPALIRIVLPLAAFAASLYVTNRMLAESELIVVQATGYSAWRLARPVLVFGLIVAGLMSVLTHVLVPASTTMLKAREADIASNATARLLREGQFLTPAEGVTFYIREITPTGELRDIFLSDMRDPDESVTYTAASAYLVRAEAGPQLVMIDGLAQTLSTTSGRLGTTSFEDLAYDIAPFMARAGSDRRTPREMPTLTLLRAPAQALEETGRPAGTLVVEGHSRFTEAALGLVGALIGFATLLVGGFSRFGVWRQIVAAIFLIIFVKLVETATTGPVRADARLWPLLYLPAVTGLAITWGLLFWATRPQLFRRRRAADAAASVPT